jgi:hypothetical protein
VGVYPTHWVETITSAGYGGGAQFRRSKAPGRLALFESNSSLTPEEYLEHGSMWEHLHRNGVTFRNYGEGFEFAGMAQDPDTKPTGGRLPVNIPMPMVLYQNTCREYPEFNMNIPDQYRVDQFLKEFREKYLSGKEPLPRFLYIYLPNDHGAGVRPNKGYPYLESYMADNDLALGRVVEALSHSPWWKEMAIFVTEDDAQSGIDHVDAHRSVLLVISPWAKRGYISHRQSSIASIMKTMYLILGIPYLNLYDAAASDLADMFTTKPDFTPYRALPVDPRIFDPEKAKDPNDPDYRQGAFGAVARAGYAGRSHAPAGGVGACAGQLSVLTVCVRVDPELPQPLGEALGALFRLLHAASQLHIGDESLAVRAIQHQLASF